MNEGIPHRIEELIVKHLMNELSADEKVELDHWLDSSEKNRLFFSQLEDRDELQSKWKDYNEADEEKIWQRLSRDIPEINLIIPAKPGIYKWTKLAIAATVISVVTFSGWYFLTKKTNTKDENPVSLVNSKTDVSPGGNKAVLTLADGTKIVLDNAQNGSIAKQGSTAILKQQNQVSYKQGLIAAANEVMYNTISTPRGGQYNVVLPDGSRVWLNAASSIHFPTQFIGKERKIEISGEAYFEVAKDKTKPFKVAIIPTPGSEKQGEIEVLGTHFNVNAYADENYFNTTLLEGSIRLTLNSKSQHADPRILAPGQQAILNKEANKLSISKNEKAESAVAWVNDIFHFEDADLKSVMRQLSRWYNVDVVYEGKVPDEKIIGDAERNIPLSKMLTRLEKMIAVHFVVQGRTIKVTP